MPLKLTLPASQAVLDSDSRSRRTLGPKSEFVVAEDRDIESDHVNQIYHMRAHVDPGKQGRRYHVASERHDGETSLGLGAGTFFGDDRGNLGRSAPTVYAGHPVPVVHMDNREGKRLGFAGRRHPAQGDRNQCRD